LIQVISDVDDTLKSSGGTFFLSPYPVNLSSMCVYNINKGVKIADIALGGIDTQYERDAIYPGVMQFMFEVALYSTKSNLRLSPLNPPKVAILTARAEEFKAALELKDDSKLGRAFIATGTKGGVSDWGLGR
jgi:hypothetical protein